MGRGTQGFADLHDFTGRPPETTIPYTGTDPFEKIAPADSAAYAAKEGVLCNDIFAAT